MKLGHVSKVTQLEKCLALDLGSDVSLYRQPRLSLSAKSQSSINQIPQEAAEQN